MPRGVFVRTEEHKRKISESKKASGFRHSDETRQRMSEARKGLPVSDETRAKLTAIMRAKPPRLGFRYTEEQKRQLSELRKGKSPNLRVYGVTDEEYSSQITAGNRWCHIGKHFATEAEMCGKQAYCKAHRSVQNRRSLLRYKYGLPDDWYEKQLAKQAGVCAICKEQKLDATKSFMHIDHDHSVSTHDGKAQGIRGILCSECNKALGFLEDQDFVSRAARYLAQYGTLLRVEETPLE